MVVLGYLGTLLISTSTPTSQVKGMPIVGRCACNPRVWEVTTEGAGVQSHPWLCRQYTASLGYAVPCLKKKGLVG